LTGLSFPPSGVTRKIHLNAWFLSETATISTTDLKPQPTFDLNTDASVLYPPEQKAKKILIIGPF
jgi:hypothetical protein